MVITKITVYTKRLHGLSVHLSCGDPSVPVALAMVADNKQELSKTLELQKETFDKLMQFKIGVQYESNGMDGYQKDGLYIKLVVTEVEF